jgi:hypothetical protein
MHDTLFYLAQSKLFANNEQLAITNRTIEKLNSENNIAVKKTKLTIKYLENNKMIGIISKRPKRHELLMRID